MKNNPVGVLDSGIGGITIVKEIMQELPGESIVYIGDSYNTPYGAKSKKEIYQLSKRMVEFLLEKHAKVIVIACNTITVSNLDTLRKEYPQIPIIGTVPVVKTAVSVTKNKRIGILSTTMTAKSEYQKNLIKTFADGCIVYNHGTDILVPLIEQGKFSGEEVETSLRSILAVFQHEKIDTLALGCTHFPFLREQMKSILGNEVQILDSGAAIARQVRRVLEHNNIVIENEKPQYSIYLTNEHSNVDEPIQKYLKTQVAVYHLGGNVTT